MTSIEPFSYDTYKFLKYDGQFIKKPTQSYIRILPPDKFATLSHQSKNNRVYKPKEESVSRTQRSRLAEINLEEFVLY
jgi:hypothetical protein